MPNRYATQGAVIAHRLMRRPHTYMEMLAMGCGYSPWKRVMEWLRLHDEFRLEKGERKGLTTWKVVRLTSIRQ